MVTTQLAPIYAPAVDLFHLQQRQMAKRALPFDW